MPVAYAGRVGDGPMGNQVMADLTAHGIPLLLPRVAGEDSGFDVALVESSAERTFVTAPGVEACLQMADLQALPLLPGDAIYVSGYDLCYPISGAALGRWLPTLPPQNLLVIDPGPLVAEIPEERRRLVFARTDLLSLNAREIAILSASTNLSEAAKHLTLQIAPDGLVVVRAGAQGCWIASSAFSPQHLPPRLTRAVDTTGAGDAHVAALLTWLAAGNDIQTAAMVANIAASIAVERSGPATGPTTQELETELPFL